MSRTEAHDQLPRRASLKQRAGWILGGVAVVAACVAIRSIGGSREVEAKTPPLPFLKRSEEKSNSKAPVPATDAAPPAKKPSVVAVVNSEPISRDDLANECLRHYGTEVLESMVNKHLIADYCRQQRIAITEAEVDAEIERIAKKFSLPKDQWLKMLEKERNIKPQQYAKDIIWPTIALRKLAASQLTVSRKELDEAYESQFGPAVKCRLIAVGDAEKAKQVHAQATAKPDSFGALARKYSEDINSASANGLIQPIRKHMGDPQLEAVAFSLREGDVSPIVQVANQYVILKCDGILPAVSVDREQYDSLLAEAIRERKLRTAANDVFRKLQDGARVENVMNDPAKSRQMPGVAAIINGHKITIRELAEECAERHGVEVLEGTINRRLLEQALRKRKQTVTQQEVEAEIARAAVSMGKTKKSGEPDIEGWIAAVTKEQGVTRELYIRDAVWPSVALKKITGEEVKVTEEDLKKAFEANYGPRVRCRAIVLNNQRKAQEVWEKARSNPTADFFGDLAEQYSIEASSRTLRGEVPPIQKHGGQPLLEREAFALQAGELSGVIQVAENFVILFCEGHTKPTAVDYKEVRQLLYDDIREKKQRIAMSQQFEMLKDAAQIDNYLAGTIKSPKKPENVAMEPKIPQAISNRRK